MGRFKSYDFNPEVHEEVCRCGNIMNCIKTTTYSEVDGGYYIHRTLKVLMCSRCNFPTVLLYKVAGNGDEEEYFQDTPIEREWECLILYGPNRQVHQAVPTNISEVFNQAEAILASSPRASFILCRAVLEEICNDFGIPAKGTNNNGKPLQQRLTQLFQQEKEIISADLKDVIEGIKELGNEGAHSTHETFNKLVTSQEADDLLALVDFVIYMLYVHKARQQEATEKLNKLKARFSP